MKNILNNIRMYLKKKLHLFSVITHFKKTFSFFDRYFKKLTDKKLDGWREAYKEQHELCSIYENFISHLKNELTNNENIDKIYKDLESKKYEHYVVNRNDERRKKLGYILENFRR